MTESADNPRDVRPTVGCVSFLNAKPLVDGLDDRDDLSIVYDVPSRLLSYLLAGDVDVALCPVIDFQCSPQPLRIVPVGGIGCDGETHTVRLFSRVPFKQIQRVRIDADSHTSIVLMHVVLADLYGVRVQTVAPSEPLDGEVDAMLLIGDKVVTAAPSDADYPHQLDLGESWKRCTGMPFVFATWMTRVDTDLGTLPGVLDAQRRANASRIDQIVARNAGGLGWPGDLAQRYLGELLKYEVGDRELKAIERFWNRAYTLGCIDDCRTMDVYPLDQPVT
ncbi:MAG: hypothetical protein GC159_04205 [Phycisphaera sp.]|nr:hypothetical protein [Phycisphaera sp.]